MREEERGEQADCEVVEQRGEGGEGEEEEVLEDDRAGCYLEVGGGMCRGGWGRGGEVVGREGWWRDRGGGGGGGGGQWGRGFFDACPGQVDVEEEEEDAEADYRRL